MRNLSEFRVGRSIALPAALLVFFAPTLAPRAWAQAETATPIPTSATNTMEAIIHPPDGAVDLRARFHDFMRAAQEIQWEAEDKWIVEEQAFGEELRRSMRELDVKLADDTAARGSEWRKAQQDASERRRAAEAEARQKIRIHREQLELELMRFERTREAHLKAFMASVETQLDSFKSGEHGKKVDHALESSINRAKEDTRIAGEELKKQLRNWQERLKKLKTSSGGD